MPSPVLMVDLKGQYLKVKEEIDAAVAEVITSAAFINGPQVTRFATHLADYLEVPYVIPCANGTDALQIALMALGLQPGDEVIVPGFTYVAPAEVIGLLGLVPIAVDVDPESFNMQPQDLEQAYSRRTKAVIPVHLFGQCAPMEPIIEWAKQRGVFVVEDAAQALGAKYKGKRAGTLGDIGCTSFFPTKNLGCFGDGGALMTKDPHLANRIKMIAQHGQQKKYIHELLGCNSRLDTLQAAILDVKLAYLDDYEAARNKAAQRYTQSLQGVEGLIAPVKDDHTTHVFHQYTLRILNGRRDGLKRHLASLGIPSMVYYPLPLHRQPAFDSLVRMRSPLRVSEQLCEEVLSLPMHTELTPHMQQIIAEQICQFLYTPQQ